MDFSEHKTFGPTLQHCLTQGRDSDNGTFDYFAVVIQEQQCLCPNCSQTSDKRRRIHFRSLKSRHQIYNLHTFKQHIPTTNSRANMPRQTQKPRYPHAQQLQRSEDRSYTSFKEMGIASPEPEEFTKDDNDEGTDRNQRTAERAGKGEGSGKGERKTMKGEGMRQRSGSIRLMEWIMRPKSSSSPP